MLPRISCRILILVVIAVLSPVLIHAGDGRDAGPSKGALGNIIAMYQKHISVVDGDRCSMVPSCSEYASQAVDKHGILMGCIMACDRLLRCGGDDTNTAEILYRNSRKYFLDPVEANDFWWVSRNHANQ
ncbi:MAG: membrane protein insertion efficiency factor YidD [Pseudomonadota bacterium]